MRETEVIAFFVSKLNGNDSQFRPHLTAEVDFLGLVYWLRPIALVDFVKLGKLSVGSQSSSHSHYTQWNITILTA